MGAQTWQDLFQNFAVDMDQILQNFAKIGSNHQNFEENSYNWDLIAVHEFAGLSLDGILVLQLLVEGDEPLLRNEKCYVRRRIFLIKFGDFW